MIRPPADEKPINFRRAALALISLGVLVATLFGYIAQHTGQPPQRIPMDSGTPAIVTTIGGPR